MYPNILFFVVDSFRADRFFGNNKTSYTPNLDLLLKKGTYFEQAISSADGTFLTLSSLFNGLFPFVTNVRSNEVILRKDNFLEIIKKNGYHIYGALPNLASFNSLLEHFENENNNDRIENSDLSTGDLIDPVAAQFLGQKIEGNHSEYERYRATLPKGLAENIIQLLESKEKQEPYFWVDHHLFKQQLER